MKSQISEAKLQAKSVLTTAYYIILPYCHESRSSEIPSAERIQTFLENVRSAKRRFREVSHNFKKDGNPVQCGSYWGTSFHDIAIKFADVVAWEIVCHLATDTEFGWGAVKNGVDGELFCEKWPDIRQGLASVDSRIDLQKINAGMESELLAALSKFSPITPEDTGMKSGESSADSADSEKKSPVAFLESPDARDLFREIEKRKDEIDPKTNRTISKNEIARQFFGGDVGKAETNLRLVRGAKKKSKQITGAAGSADTAIIRADSGSDTL